jgi:hypothetical protein
MPVALVRPAFLILGDGRWLLRLSAWSLLGAGIFAFLLGVSGEFLPHDEAFLGMSARDLCAVHGCKIVHFMIHDRVSFGGALAAVGILYWWLVEVPLRRGEAWAWWLLVLSGVLGFASFFTYLGYGYLDTWHGLATLALLPCYGLGLVQARSHLDWQGVGCLVRPSSRWPWSLGRTLLLATALGMVFGGLTIMTVGATCVFVPQDLEFMDLSVEELQALNPRLVPLIAHDRAGFGGAVACAGMAVFFCVWCGTPSRGLWWTLVLVGIAGFGAGVGAHPAVGYNDPLHLAPAVIGAITFALGLGFSAHTAFLPSPLYSGERGRG